MAEDPRSLSKRRYTQFARRYVESPTHAQGDDLDRLLAVAQPESDWLALDVATGGGHTALKFAPFLTRVVASDLTPTMLLEARSFILKKGATNLEFISSDAEALAFPEDSFNLVTCRIAPHHFINCENFIHEVARVLKPEGLLLVQDHMLPDDRTAGLYIDDFERLRDPSHNRAFSKNQWIDMFQESGLIVEYAETITKRHDFNSWVERQNCSQEVIQELAKMIMQAPPPVEAWLQPQNFPSPTASFAHVFIIISGRKKSPAFPFNTVNQK